MADQTTIQETSQALFCALADYSGLANTKKIFDVEKYPTYGIFKSFWNGEGNPVKNLKISEAFKQKVDAPSVTLKIIEDFLTKNNEWYISSVLIAKKLIEDIDKISSDFNQIKRPKWSDIFYVRGDDLVMKNIAALFKVANDTQKKINQIDDSKRSIVFGDINKWSPADIYLASDKAKKNIQQQLNEAKKNKSYSFLSLNKLISENIDSGDLLPLSLKKTTKQVVLQKVNFNRSSETKELKKYFYNGVSSWKKYTVNSPQTRDLKIYFTQDKKDHMKIRHDPSSFALKSEFQIAGAEARGGSIGSASILSDVINLVDKQFSKKFLNLYEEGNKKFTSKLKDLGPKPKTENGKKQYDSKRAELSALYITNNIFPSFIEWIEKGSKNGKSDEFVRCLYQYITSRTTKSSKFVIAK